MRGPPACGHKVRGQAPALPGRARPAIALALAAMYGGHAIEFFHIKQDLDPAGVLRNEFLKRTFSGLLKQACL